VSGVGLRGHLGALGLLLAAVALIGAAMPARADTRVALVIGNSKYEHVVALKNPANDAELIASKLKAVGYQVTLLKDVKINDFLASVRAFAAQAHGADAAVLFYAGHGVQVDGKNWLIPVDADISSAADLPLSAISLNTIMDAMASANVSIVFLDACRDDPFKSLSGGSGRGILFDRGLAAVPNVNGQALVAFAAAPGETAADGEGDDSYFSLALADALVKPGVSINDMLVDVTASVKRASGDHQVPWYNSGLSKLFYFVPAGMHVAAAPPPPAGTVFRDCANMCPEMVVLPTGSFSMGSPDSEEGHEANEGPQHSVTIAQPFALGKYDVTFEEWDACVKDGGCNLYVPGDNGWGRGKNPVINVSWYEAEAYVQWLSQKTGFTYRLPTEAEWEYAARAGSTTPFYWGRHASHDNANYGADACCGGYATGDDKWVNTSPVGSFPKNDFGLYDMAGNVAQWTQDCYRKTYDGVPADGSAWQSGGCNARLMRGGTWISDPKGIRSAFRIFKGPVARLNLGGFRVARSF